MAKKRNAGDEAQTQVPKRVRAQDPEPVKAPMAFTHPLAEPERIFNFSNIHIGPSACHPPVTLYMSKVITDFNAASKGDSANTAPAFLEPALQPPTSAIPPTTSTIAMPSNSQSTLPTLLTAPATESGPVASIFSENSSVPKVSASQGGIFGHGVTQNQPPAVKLGGNMFTSEPSFGHPSEPLPSKPVRLEPSWAKINTAAFDLSEKSRNPPPNMSPNDLKNTKSGRANEAKQRAKDRSQSRLNNRRASGALRQTCLNAKFDGEDVDEDDEMGSSTSMPMAFAHILPEQSFFPKPAPGSPPMNAAPYGRNLPLFENPAPLQNSAQLFNPDITLGCTPLNVAPSAPAFPFFRTSAPQELQDEEMGEVEAGLESTQELFSGPTRDNEVPMPEEEASADQQNQALSLACDIDYDMQGCEIPPLLPATEVVDQHLHQEIQPAHDVESEMRDFDGQISPLAPPVAPTTEAFDPKTGDTQMDTALVVPGDRADIKTDLRIPTVNGDNERATKMDVSNNSPSTEPSQMPQDMEENSPEINCSNGPYRKGLVFPEDEAVCDDEEITGNKTEEDSPIQTSTYQTSGMPRVNAPLIIPCLYPNAASHPFASYLDFKFPTRSQCFSVGETENSFDAENVIASSSRTMSSLSTEEGAGSEYPTDVAQNTGHISLERDENVHNHLKYSTKVQCVFTKDSDDTNSTTVENAHNDMENSAPPTDVVAKEQVQEEKSNIDFEPAAPESLPCQEKKEYAAPRESNEAAPGQSNDAPRESNVDDEIPLLNLSSAPENPPMQQADYQEIMKRLQERDSEIASLKRENEALQEKDRQIARLQIENEALSKKLRLFAKVDAKTRKDAASFRKLSTIRPRVPLFPRKTTGRRPEAAMEQEVVPEPPAVSDQDASEEQQTPVGSDIVDTITEAPEPTDVSTTLTTSQVLTIFDYNSIETVSEAPEATEFSNILTSSEIMTIFEYNSIETVNEAPEATEVSNTLASSEIRMNLEYNSVETTDEVAEATESVALTTWCGFKRILLAAKSTCAYFSSTLIPTLLILLGGVCFTWQVWGVGDGIPQIAVFAPSVESIYEGCSLSPSQHGFIEELREKELQTISESNEDSIEDLFLRLARSVPDVSVQPEQRAADEELGDEPQPSSYFGCGEDPWDDVKSFGFMVLCVGILVVLRRLE